jgi:hypothetical protein
VSLAGADRGQPLFSPRTAIVLALVGVFAFSAFVTLIAFSGDLMHDSSCRPNVYAKCAIGFAGLESAILEDATPTLINRSSLPRGSTEGLIIATLEPGGDSAVSSIDFGGPILVVLPKWTVSPDPNHLTWARKEGLLPPFMMPSEDVLAKVGVAHAAGGARHVLTGAANTPFEGVTLTPGPIESLQTLTAQGWTPVLTDETGAVVMAEAPSSRIFVLADPDLLNTQGLRDVNTFAAATQIVSRLREGDGPIIFDLTLNGYKIDRSALKLIFQPPFVGVTLCVVAALALAVWQSLFRFGPLRRSRRAFALGKEGLVDNSAQLIRLAHREPKMAPRYAALTRAAAARAVGAPRDLTGDELTAFLDRVSRREDGDSLGLLTALAGGVHDRAGLTAVARRLYLWRLEMTRERQ